MKIEAQVIDDDGSCRDVNFPDVEKWQAIALIEYVQEFCVLNNARDSNGNNLSVEMIVKHLSVLDTETIVSDWECHGLISHIRLFFYWKDKSNIFVELTFFPQSINKQNYSLENFIAWLKPILVSLNTSIYYVRYESASWEYGDTSKSSGVIFSNIEYPING